MYRNCEVAVFALSSSNEFGREMCTCPSLKTRLDKSEDFNFPDGESYARPDVNVRGKDVFVIQSLHGVGGESVDVRLAKLAIFNNATRFASAARITNVIPYHAYTRQDRKTRSRDPLSLKQVANQLMTSGVNRILGMDWHNPAVQNAYDIPVDILDPTVTLANYLYPRVLNDEKIVLFAPDVGATERNDAFAQRLAKKLEKDIGLAVALKRREGDKVKLRGIVGDVKDAVTVTYDDESVTGSTFILSANAAKEQGAKKCIGIMTHAKCTEEGVKRLEDSGLDEIIVTDTIWRPNEFFKDHPKFTKVSIAPLFAEAIRRIHNSESISVMYGESL